MARSGARKASLEEFVREVVVAMRAAGLEGEVSYDKEHGRLTHAELGTFDVVSTHQQIGAAPPERRLEFLAKAARIWVHPPELPKSWGEASTLIVPHVRTRMSAVVEDLRRQAANALVSRPRAEFTPHLVVELAIQVEGATLTVSTEAFSRWGIEVDAAFRVAGQNLHGRSSAQWLETSDAPGVYGSPWRDGMDASRITLPRLFGRVPLRGRAVVVAPSPFRLLLAGSDDAEGLFQMARLARQSFERNRAFHFLRALRMGEDGESWEDWIPPREHPAYDPLRLLRGVQEVHEYDEQATVLRQLAPPGQEVVPLPRLHLVQSSVGATSLTVTTWRDGKARALPKADAVVFQRGEEVLGFAPWERVEKALPGALRPMGGYPVRYLAADFPEDWQLGPLHLEPWNAPPL